MADRPPAPPGSCVILEPSLTHHALAEELAAPSGALDTFARAVNIPKALLQDCPRSVASQIPMNMLPPRPGA